MTRLQSEDTKKQKPGLATQAVRGSLWVGASRYINFAIKFTSGIILARLLAPEDFGVVALATATFMILSRLKAIGIGTAIIQRKDDDPSVLSTLFWTQTAISVAIFFLALFIVLFTDLFDPITARVFLIIAFFQTANAITQPVTAIMRRRFQFKQLSLVEIGLSLLAPVASVAMAYLGYGLWSLVWPGMIALLVQGLFYWRISGWRPNLAFDWNVIRELRQFSTAYWSFGLLEQFVHNIDDILLGNLGGTTSLGFYSKAYNTSELFHTNVGGVIATTALPLFSRYQQDHRRLRQAYEMVIKLVLKTGGLFYITLAVLAYEIVGLLYGEKWLPMVPILWFMLPYALLLPLFNLSKNFLIAIDRISDVAWAFCWMAVILLAGLIPGILFFGSVGAAAAVDLAIGGGLLYELVKIGKVFELNIAGTLLKSMGLVLAHGILLLLLKQMLTPFAAWLTILIVGTYSAGVFLILAWLFDRNWLRHDVYLFYATARGRSMVA